jgi:hypothetical protein
MLTGTSVRYVQGPYSRPVRTLELEPIVRDR